MTSNNGVKTTGSRVSKAWGGGVAGGLAAAGVYLQANSFSLDAAGIGGLAGAFVTGFVVGFVGVFLAPANKTA